MGLRQRTHFVRCGRRHFSSQIEMQFRFGLRVKVVLLCSTKTRISSKWACDKELTLFVVVAAISPLKSKMNFDLVV